MKSFLVFLSLLLAAAVAGFRFRDVVQASRAGESPVKTARRDSVRVLSAEPKTVLEESPSGMPLAETLPAPANYGVSLAQSGADLMNTQAAQDALVRLQRRTLEKQVGSALIRLDLSPQEYERVLDLLADYKMRLTSAGATIAASAAVGTDLLQLQEQLGAEIADCLGRIEAELNPTQAQAVRDIMAKAGDADVIKVLLESAKNIDQPVAEGADASLLDSLYGVTSQFVFSNDLLDPLRGDVSQVNDSRQLELYFTEFADLQDKQERALAPFLTERQQALFHSQQQDRLVKARRSIERMSSLVKKN